jgi:hypothetical protein
MHLVTQRQANISSSLISSDVYLLTALHVEMYHAYMGRSSSVGWILTYCQNYLRRVPCVYL